MRHDPFRWPEMRPLHRRLRPWSTLTALVLVVVAGLSGSASAQQPTAGSAAPTAAGSAAPTAAGSAAPTAAGSADPTAAGSAAPVEAPAPTVDAAAPTAAAPTAAAPAGAGSAAAKAPGELPFYEVLARRPHDTSGNYWLPKGANRYGDGTDMMFIAVLALSIFFFVAITVATVYFVIKYRHRPGHKAQPSSSHNDALEITWTVIPTIMCVFLFYYGWRGYYRMVTPPQKALEIQVIAQKWAWNFVHSPVGVSDSNLHIPVNTPVRLVMTSKDVLHSFFVPAFRTKQDVIPNRYTYVWFEATKPGTYRLYCTEYCGRDHSQMKVNVVVHEPGGYERYLSEADASSQVASAENGAKLYEKKACIGCHSLDGSPRVGPSFKGIFGSTIALKDGTSVAGDENYLRAAILNPQAQARPGYPPSMPAFEGQLKESELMSLILFIKAQK